MRTFGGLLFLALISCDRSPSPPPAPPPGVVDPAPPTPAGFGTVTGTVRVAEGEEISPLVGRATGFEAYCHSNALDLGIYRVDPAGRGLADVFVSVEGAPDDFTASGPQILDQKSCLFAPPVLVVAPGEVLLRNSDTISHNTRIDAKLNPPVNVNLSAGTSTAVRLTFGEKLIVKCSIHPWMASSLIVTRSKAHALTDGAGRFRIEGVPAGRRRIRFWHALGDELLVEAEVAVGGSVDLQVAWKPRPGYRDGYGR